MEKIDTELLKMAIRCMTPQQKIYKVIREELMLQGHWRNLPRGNPSKGYKVMKENKKNKHD